jgi:hypothetical protein
MAGMMALLIWWCRAAGATTHDIRDTSAAAGCYPKREAQAGSRKKRVLHKLSELPV